MDELRNAIISEEFLKNENLGKVIKVINKNSVDLIGNKKAEVSKC